MGGGGNKKVMLSDLIIKVTGVRIVLIQGGVMKELKVILQYYTGGLGTNEGLFPRHVTLSVGC